MRAFGLDETIALALLALASMVSTSARAQDVKALEKDLSEYEYGVVERSADALLAMQTPEADQALARALGHKNPFVRDHVFAHWTQKPAEASLAWITNRGLAEADARIRRHLVELLARWQATEAREALIVVLTRDRDPQVRGEAARALAALGPAEKVVEALASRAGSSEWEERVAVVEALAALEWDPSGKAQVERALSASHPYIRVGALLVLAERDPAAALPAAIEQSKDSSWQVRAAAIHVLAELREKDGVGPLIDRLEKDSGRLHHDAWVALKKLTGKPIADNAEMWRNWWASAKDSFDMAAVQPAPDPKDAPKNGEPAGANDSQVTYYGVVIYSNRLVFTLDLSGSMEDPVGGGKTKLGAAKDELRNTLSAFRPTIYFNFVFFPTVIQPWKERLQPATPANLAAALKFVEVRAARDNPGGNRGNMYDALMHAILDPNTDTVYVLSDGRPSAGEYQDADRFLERFGLVNRYARLEVHTILVGKGRTDRSFMQTLADSTGGQMIER